MKKKFELYCSSFKASACTKPTALLMFILLIVVVTIAVGMPLRIMYCSLEYKLYEERFLLINIDNNPIDFSEYRVIGEKLKHINDKDAFDKDKYNNTIKIYCHKNQLTKEDGQVSKLGKLTVKFEVAPYHFTQEEIDSESKKMICSREFFKEHGLKHGERVIFEGIAFTVYEQQRDTWQSGNYFLLPYTVSLGNIQYEASPPRDDDNNFIGDVKFYGGGIDVNGRQDILSAFELDILKDIGVAPYESSSWGLFILPMIILAVILLGGVASILTIYNYILKINGRRYAIYKIIGVPPLTVSGIMLTESITLTSVGVGVGIFIEWLINKLFVVESLVVGRLMWLHCLSLLAVPLLLTLICVGVKIIAHAKAVPIAVKYLQ